MVPSLRAPFNSFALSSEMTHRTKTSLFVLIVSVLLVLIALWPGVRYEHRVTASAPGAKTESLETLVVHVGLPGSPLYRFERIGRGDQSWSWSSELRWFSWSTALLILAYALWRLGRRMRRAEPARIERVPGSEGPTS